MDNEIFILARGGGKLGHLLTAVYEQMPKMEEGKTLSIVTPTDTRIFKLVTIIQ